MPSIEQVMPWLHLVFDAYEDYKKVRAREAAEREAAEREAAERAALETAEHGDESAGRRRRSQGQEKAATSTRTGNSLSAAAAP